MKIQLSPIAGHKISAISVKDEIITYDGVDYDMGDIPDGGEVIAEAPAVGIIKRIDGVIEIILHYFYDSNDCTYADRFPEVLDVVSGDVKPTTGVQHV